VYPVRPLHYFTLLKDNLQVWMIHRKYAKKDDKLKLGVFGISILEMISTHCVMRLERRTAWNSEARAQHTQYASPASNYTTRTVPQSRPTDHRIDRTVDQNTLKLSMKFVQKLSLFTVSWS
jgi:hypothetical protein